MLGRTEANLLKMLTKRKRNILRGERREGEGEGEMPGLTRTLEF